MKSKIKCFAAVMLAMLTIAVLETVSERKVYARGADTSTAAEAQAMPKEIAEETEKPKVEIVINGVDFSNIDLENFQLSDFSTEQWAVLADVMEAYGDGGEWSLSGLSGNEDGEGDEAEKENSFGSGDSAEKKEPIRAERKGTGTTGTAIVTSNDLQGAMEFVKITTKDDQMFFLVVDYTKEEDNVYFLDVVTVNDLLHIAETEVDADENPIYIDYSKFEKKDKEGQETEDGKTVSGGEAEGQESDKAQEKEGTGGKKSALSGEMLQNAVLLLGIVLIGGIAFGIIYFMKIKNKKVDEDDDDFADGESFEDEDDEDEIFESALDLDEESGLEEDSEESMGDIGGENLVDIDDVEAETSEYVGDDETDNSDF